MCLHFVFSKHLEIKMLDSDQMCCLLNTGLVYSYGYFENNFSQFLFSLFLMSFREKCTDVDRIHSKSFIKLCVL